MKVVLNTLNTSNDCNKQNFKIIFMKLTVFFSFYLNYKYNIATKAPLTDASSMISLH